MRKNYLLFLRGTSTTSQYKSKGASDSFYIPKMKHTPSNVTAVLGEVTKSPQSPNDTRWVEKEGWCNLCNLPFTSWGQHVMPHHHIGHRMLEMVYDTIVRSHLRVWSPRALILGSLRRLSPAGSPDLATGLPKLYSLQDHDDAAHTKRIHKVLMYLLSLGVFDGIFDKARSEGNNNIIKASNLAPIAVMKHLLVLFKEYDSGYLSEAIQLICSHDNFQDVFTLLGGEQIAEAYPKNKLFWECDYLRAILGELHHLAIGRPRRRTGISVEIRSLSQFTFHACIAELVLRIVENMVSRVDAVWRRHSAPFMNTSLPKGHPLNRGATDLTVSRPAFRPELDVLQVNQFTHESWPNRASRNNVQIGQKLQYPPLGPHSYNTFRPRFSQFFKDDSNSTVSFD